MSDKSSKRLEQMRANPRGNWRISDIVALCREYDVTCEAPRGGGSHYKVGHSVVAEKLTIPYKRPIKPVYIQHLVEFIDLVRRSGE